MTRTITFIFCILILLASIANLGIVVTSSEGPLAENESFQFFINLKAARFDPLLETPDIPLVLTYSDENNYYLVQCNGPIQSEWVPEILEVGANILGYVPEYTYILYMEKDVKKSVSELPFVRWVGIYHPAYKIDQNLLTKQGSAQLNVQVFNTDGNLGNFRFVKEQLLTLGGTIIREESDVHNIIVEIDVNKIIDIAFIPEVEWLGEYSPPKALMDNIRVFTGAESPLHEYGFNGTGIVGEVKDSGLDQDHPEFEGQLLATDGNVEEDAHGTSTFGIVFAKGVNNRAMGMMPGAQGVFASWGVGRKQSIANLVNNWDGVFQSNSWSAGSADGTYGSNSRQNDDAIFEYDATMLYATGNGGSEGSISQEATAKNVIGVGAFNHYNNQDRTDDRHTGNQGNRGPTADGRIKPDVVGPYDSIYTTTSGDRYTSGFGGTSGATPVAAGAVGLIYEMYKENHFGNNPTGATPHAATVKALLIADAYQYEFSQGGRFAQGWGLVDVGNVYNIGKNHLIDDENNVVKTGDTQTYKVGPIGTTPLKISLVWTDVPGTMSSSQHLINDLDLKVTDPNGVVYYGNYGLETSKWSSAGGEADHINNVENVFIENPIIGEWTIEVKGENIPRDGVTNTIDVDQNYALVASGVAKYDHDLRVQSLNFPRFVGVGENVPINASISNIGSNDEIGVKVEFLVDNTTYDTTIVNSIDVGEIIDTNFIWTPTEVKEYYISIYIEPMNDEVSILDNRRDGIISVSKITGMVLVDDSHGTDQNHHLYYYYIETMGPEKYRVHHTTNSITSELLANYDVFITAWPTQSYTIQEISSIEDFVEFGGGLLVVGESDNNIYDDLTDYAGITWGTPYILLYDGETNEINQHEITENVSSLYFDSPQLPLVVEVPAEEIVYTYGGMVYNRVTVAAAEYGQGKVVAIADSDCLNSQFISEVDNRIFGENIIKWLANERPIAIIDSPLNNSNYMITDTIQFDGSSSYDPEGDVLTYLWSSDISGELGDTPAFSTTLTSGVHIITLEVGDAGGKIGTAKIMLRVLSPPTVEIQFPSDGSILIGNVELSGTALDIDGIIHSVEVQFDDGPWLVAIDTSSSNDWSTWSLSWESSNVIDGDHAISVRSLDNDGLYSGIERIAVIIDNTPPSIITGPEVHSITDTEATIAWETDEPSDGMVEYGTSSSYGNSESTKGFTPSHKFVLTDLLPDTLYHYRVISSDEAGNSPTTSRDYKFETALPPDFTPPNVVITNPLDTDILQGDVIITADVSDNYGIANVEFYIDGILEFTDDTPDYSWLWDTTNGFYPDGQYSLKIIAIDLSENVAIDEITVTLDNEIIPPSIVRTRVTPSSVTITTGETTNVLFIIEVTDPENRLESITIDLSPIDGSSSQPMYDDGSHGDEVAGDYVYSLEATISSNILEGEKSMTIIITYYQDTTIETSVNLDVFSPPPDEVSETGSSNIQLDWDFWLLPLILLVLVGAVLGALALVSKRNRPGEAVEVVPLEQTRYNPIEDEF